MSSRGMSRKRVLARRRKKRNVRILMLLGILFLIFILLIQGIKFVKSKIKHPEITLTVKSIQIKRGEEIPSFEVQVKGKDLKDKPLSKEAGFTSKDLLEEFQGKKGYKISFDSEKATMEGKYGVKILLDEDIKEKLHSDWKKKVNVVVKNGQLTIVNPVGKWKGDKFQRYEGGYVLNEFIFYKNKYYYFDENGDKTVGLKRDTTGVLYYFNKNGVMQRGWKDIKDKSYYFQDSGAATVGFSDIDGATYYFDEEGQMLTGKQTIGRFKCVFGKAGKMTKREVEGIDTSKPMIALTFDDGPGKFTDELLDGLEKYDATATFFLLGSNIPGYEETLKKMDKIGCEVANHSFSHPQLTKLGGAEIAGEVNRTNDLIAGAIGKRGTSLRPPYGAIDDKVRTHVGTPMILWNRDTLDWKTKNKRQIVDHILGTAEDGDIILLHDIYKESVDAAIEAVPKLMERGFQLVTVSELAAARGINLVPGESYTSFPRAE